MTNTAFTTTEADQFLIDTWAARVEQTRQRELIFADVMVDAKVAYQAPVRGFQNLFITKTSLLNSGSARSKSEGNNNTLTYDTETGTPVTLTVNQWKYQALEVEEFAQALTTFNIADTYLNEVGEVIARDEDSFLAGFVDNFSLTGGTLGVENSEDEILAAIQSLDDNDVPKDNRHWVFSPKAHARLLAQNKFTSIDYVDSKGVASGRIPALYNIPVHVSPNVEGTNAAGHDNGLLRSSAVTRYRVGEYPKMRQVMSEDNLSDKYAISNIYGAVEVRDADGYFLKGA